MNRINSPYGTPMKAWGIIVKYLLILALIFSFSYELTNSYLTEISDRTELVDLDFEDILEKENFDEFEYYNEHLSQMTINIEFFLFCIESLFLAIDNEFTPPTPPPDLI